LGFSKFGFSNSHNLYRYAADICQVQVAVRILEMEEDGSGNVIGYKDVSGEDGSDDGGDDYDSDPAPPPGIKRGGGIFGWREKEEERAGTKVGLCTSNQVDP
jgi:hypothetical protein